MDLKFKGKRWLSDKSQKWLETVFNEIDGFISGDKTECAEDQVPTVGDSVKADCPNVTQNLLPCYLEEPGYFDAQVGSSKDSDTDETYIDAKLDTEEKLVCRTVNKSSAELDSVDQSNNTNEEFYDPSSGSYVGEADGDLPKGWELNGTLDEAIIIVEETKPCSDKSYADVVKGNNTNDKSGKLATQGGSLECNGGLENYFKSMLSIGENHVDAEVNKFSMNLEVDPSNNCHEKFSDLPRGNCIEEADCYISSGSEIDALKNTKSNSVFDEIIITKEEELIDGKTYIVFEENYVKEDLAHETTDGLAEENATNKKQLYRKVDIVEDYYSEESPWQEKLDQCVPGTKDFPEASSLREFAQEKVDLVNCVNDVATAMQSSDIEGFCVESEAVDMEVTSSSNSLPSEIYSVLQPPCLEGSHPDENFCSSSLHALGRASEVPIANLICNSQNSKLACCGELNMFDSACDTHAMPSSQVDLPPSEIGLSGICVEKKAKAVEKGRGSSKTSLSTESCSTLELSRRQENSLSNHVPTLRCASDLPCSVSSSHASQTLTYDSNFVDTILSSNLLSMLSGELGKVDIDDPGMETIELVDNSEKAKLDGSCVIVDNELLHAAYFRALRNKSYKKILQDAFASRKRLRKEYEQLAIIYGDIDIETSPQPEMHLLSPAPSSSIHSEKSFPGSSEPDWELL